MFWRQILASQIIAEVLNRDIPDFDLPISTTERVLYFQVSTLAYWKSNIKDISIKIKDGEYKLNQHCINQNELETKINFGKKMDRTLMHKWGKIELQHADTFVCMYCLVSQWNLNLVHTPLFHKQNMGSNL